MEVLALYISVERKVLLKTMRLSMNLLWGVSYYQIQALKPLA